MAWYWIVLIAYFGINLLLTLMIVIIATQLRYFHISYLRDIFKGLFLALPMLVISLINGWIGR